jgi:hypothetical protein
LGTESGVFVSFDDGDHWQSFQLNLPNAGCRDIIFAGNDLVIGTFGRGIWVLDDYAVLRQMTNDVAREPVHLFTPQPTVRVRRNDNYDTPFPPEVPHALNPPEGVVIDYWLAAKPTGEISLDVLDSAGATIRHLSSVPAAPVKEAAEPPNASYWLARPQHLPTDIGTNRTNWDLRYEPPPAFLHTWEINANPGLTPTTPEGPLAAPGTYTLKLTVDSKSYTAKVIVTNDPRSPATVADVRAQLALQLQLIAAMRVAYDGYTQAAAVRARMDSLLSKDSSSASGKAIAALRVRVDSLAGTIREDRFGSGDPRHLPTDFASLHGRLEDLFIAQENGDLAPTQGMRDVFATSCRDLNATVAKWRALSASAVPEVNAALSKAGKSPIPPAPTLVSPRC